MKILLTIIKSLKNIKRTETCYITFIFKVLLLQKYYITFIFYLLQNNNNKRKRKNTKIEID